MPTWCSELRKPGFAGSQRFAAANSLPLPAEYSLACSQPNIARTQLAIRSHAYHNTIGPKNVDWLSFLSSFLGSPATTARHQLLTCVRAMDIWIKRALRSFFKNHAFCGQCALFFVSNRLYSHVVEQVWRRHPVPKSHRRTDCIE